MDAEFSIIHSIWPENAEAIRKLRKIVFIIEQGVDPKIEWDGRDHLCQHAIAITNAGEEIATGRILPTGHIGRIAVLANWRGKGVGSAILKKLMMIAEDGQFPKVYLNSQTHALAFYQRFGFITEGPFFMEAGILHQRMIYKPLTKP